MNTTPTTSTLETPTWTKPTLFAIILASVIVAHAPKVHSTLVYLPSPEKVNQLVARVNPWRSRILRSNPIPRKANKRHKKKRPKPSPSSATVTGALCAQIKETQHFDVEHEAHRKDEVQHPRYVNPGRVGKKKPLDPRPRQAPTKAKRNEERRVESKIHKQPHQRRKSRIFKHNRRTYISGN
jgi:hypothetical protein